MKNVMLVSPTYGPLLPETVTSTLMAVMHAAGVNVRWRGTVCPERMAWEAARNHPVDGLRDRTDLDGLMWLDSDMQIPVDAITRLVDHDKDLVSALYFQRQPPYWPNAYKWLPSKKLYSRLQQYEDDVIVPIDGFGFGCCYTSMRLIRALPPSPFKFGDFSEDLTFCAAAIKIGFQPYLDTGIKCDHYEKLKWANEKSFKRWSKVALQGGEDAAVYDSREKDLLRVPTRSEEFA